MLRPGLLQVPLAFWNNTFTLLSAVSLPLRDSDLANFYVKRTGGRPGQVGGRQGPAPPQPHRPSPPSLLPCRAVGQVEGHPSQGETDWRSSGPPPPGAGPVLGVASPQHRQLVQGQRGWGRASHLLPGLREDPWGRGGRRPTGVSVLAEGWWAQGRSAPRSREAGCLFSPRSAWSLGPGRSDLPAAGSRRALGRTGRGLVGSACSPDPSPTGAQEGLPGDVARLPQAQGRAWWEAGSRAGAWPWRGAP